MADKVREMVKARMVELETEMLGLMDSVYLTDRDLWYRLGEVITAVTRAKRAAMTDNELAEEYLAGRVS
jgi:hypothetical protein